MCADMLRWSVRGLLPQTMASSLPDHDAGIVALTQLSSRAWPLHPPLGCSTHQCHSVHARMLPGVVLNIPEPKVGHMFVQHQTRQSSFVVGMYRGLKSSAPAPKSPYERGHEAPHQILNEPD